MAVAIEHREGLRRPCSELLHRQGERLAQWRCGIFHLSDTPEPIRDDVLKMKIDEVSKPYKRAGSYEIYKITDRRTVSCSLDHAKDTIRVQIFNNKFNKELATSWTV